MTHDQIVTEVNNILSAPYTTNIHRYCAILCHKLEIKYKDGIGLTADERCAAFDILSAQIEEQYKKL